MRLQYAMDRGTVDEALVMLRRLAGVIDIFEVGTPMLLRFGLGAVKAVKRAYPALTVLADAKIMDGGEFEADHCYQSGADIVTVMGLANRSTVEGALKSARHAGGRLLADMMNVRELEAESAELVKLGVDYLCVHNASDVLDMERAVSEAERVALAVAPGRLVIAGGVNPETIGGFKRFSPEVLVVGSAISHAADPRAMAVALREIYEGGIVT